VLRLYVERFNRRDWDGLRELIAADARLRVADCFDGRFKDSPYLGNYERWRGPWRMALGEVEGETAVIVMRLGDTGDWIPQAPISIEFAGAGIHSASGETASGETRETGRIIRIVDCVHCPWVLDTASHVSVEDVEDPIVL
jgi:RNA polymerase sigma-70 factor (ECF subfamily)